MSMHIIDEMASVNFCSNLHSIGHFIRNIKFLPESLKNCQKIKESKEFLDINLEEYKR